MPAEVLAFAIATLTAPAVDPAPQPPPPRLEASSSLVHAQEVQAYSRTLTAQFQAFSDVERRRRKVQGSLRIGAGVTLLAIGVANFVIKRGTTAEGSGLGILGTGAVSVGSGIYSLAVKGPAQTFVESEVFRHGASEGWSPQMLDAIRRETQIEATKARRLRHGIGSALIVGGTGAGIAISTLLGLELRKDQPDGVLASSYAQGLGTSLAVVVAGVVNVAVPTIIEVVAKNLRKR